ncbi:neuromedin-U receptor 1 [Cephus cinctus]|uniref:Neuromedin-U receptor 1 n=1 Tax=Cephus cinctus TaxID=211228 RepID=A0AAJ7C799_CEPCN|nr:neuromedin-U receptor 1 [Cephus cinctus]
MENSLEIALPTTLGIVREAQEELFQRANGSLFLGAGTGAAAGVETEDGNLSDSSLASNPYDPPRDPLYVVIPISVIYVAIFLTGIVGNVSTCIVIARNKSMHTATNYYLFSLAISDLLLLVSGLPAEIYLVWSKYRYVFGEVFCVLRGLAAEMSTNATVLTITAFTIERYVAICHPFLSQTMSKLSRAIKLILLIWVIAASFAIPQALQFGIVTGPTEDSDYLMCTFKTEIIQHSFELSTFLFFVVPMVLITVLYVLIGLKLHQSNMMKSDSGKSYVARKSYGKSRHRDRNCRHHAGKSSRRVLKMLVAVVLAFFICWAPFHVQRLIAIYGTNSADHINSNSPWMEFLYLLFTYVSGVLYYVSTTINPILYNIMSNKFREAFMETLARCCRATRFSSQREQRSYSSLSRSQQRGAAGIFGRRNAETGGAQESTDWSGNSVREESSRAGTGIVVCAEPGSSDLPGGQALPTCAGRQAAVPSMRRTFSGEIGATDTTSASLSGQSSRRILPLQERTNDQQSRPICAARPANGLGIRNISYMDEGLQAQGVGVRRYGGSRNNGYDPSRKWWTLFGWLARRKSSLESSAGKLTCTIPTGIDENREEYSMTACNISNSSLRDVDASLMDDELSAYMNEIRIKELRGQQKMSDNG